MFSKAPYLNRNKRKSEECIGLPATYPKPILSHDLLFYIQRNHNTNTIIYTVNLDGNGMIHSGNPMNIQWIRFSDNGEIKELDYLQNKLVYGYEHHKVNNKCYQFRFNAKKKMNFYLSQDESGKVAAYSKHNDRLIQISNFYVHADDIGIFPDVKFIEIYGTDVEKKRPFLQKIRL